MNKKEALKIIGMIVDGLNPFDDNFIVNELPENNPVTIRALCIALYSLLSEKDKEDLSAQYQRKKISELAESFSGPLEVYLQHKEREFIGQVLEEVKFNEEEATKKLGITLQKLRERMISYGLNIMPAVMNPMQQCLETDSSIDQILEKIEKDITISAIFNTKYNKQRAADLLGITYRQIRHKISMYNLESIKDVPVNYFHIFKIESLETFLVDIEIRAIIDALKAAHFNKSNAAHLLNISFRSLRHRLDKYKGKIDLNKVKQDDIQNVIKARIERHQVFQPISLENNEKNHKENDQSLRTQILGKIGITEEQLSILSISKGKNSNRFDE